MAKLEELNQDMKVAMKAKDRESLTTIRMLKSALQNEQISKGEELTDDEELTVLAREKKQRLESLHEFQEADRKDLVEKLEKELSIVDRYLPEQLTEEEISQIVQDAVVQTGADSMKDMGKVMGAILPKVKGKADGSLVSSLVKKELSK
ncbi:GatB/YqeY domain-containing protein [Marinilactibacillus sp. XAAS-LB27]|uniref:GatB/YqeY domain-containing protein n=1 Tax=Marinilactibacillus sp. XAAS-LB27 TaxID=3114538 RepID=UPI002E1908C1|nr:GatB/YqeY domain-containing protein [Marinilactibacillus sp. XAAS-LB27]